jgi:ABC-2 type transport system permease protein
MNAYERIPTLGWRQGFNNLFLKEWRSWWRTNQWWMQALIWLVILNGLVAMMLFVLPEMTTSEGNIPIDDPLLEAVRGFFAIGALALSIGVIVLAQDKIIEEKNNGTAEWVLSKPLSRVSFILSKLTANLFGVLLIMILLQSSVVYLQVLVVDPQAISLVNFITAAGILTLQVFFYLTLTFMLGVLAERRQVVLGVSLGFLLSGMLLRIILGQLSMITPWLLGDIAGAIATGAPWAADFLMPILFTAIWSVAFVILSLWRFECHEF